MIGLTIGKYAPLHKGHQYVIETALKEVDKLIIFLYDCPECIDVPIEKREEWIKSIYPKENIRIIKIFDGPKILGKTEEIMRLHVNCIIDNLKKNGIEKIDVFYSSEFYGEYVSKVLKCENRIVDFNREKYKISASMIKENVEKYKDYLDDVVYDDLKRYLIKC